MANLLKCRFCGKSLDKYATHCPHCGEALSFYDKKRKTIIWCISIIALFILTLLLFKLFSSSKADMFASTDMTEQESWDLICQYRDTNSPDSLEGALLIYQNNYPRGKHALAVQTLKERLFKEAREWNKVEENGSTKELLERYMAEYSKEGFFYNRAMAKLDSITFFEKLESNTVEDYQAYIDQYPEGIYVEQARTNMDKLDAISISAKEEENVQNVINNHFDALSSNDSLKLGVTIARQLSSYLGKSYCNKNDVYMYMHHVYETPGRELSFETSDFVIKKMPYDEDKPLYNVSFSLYEEMNKPSATDKNHETERRYHGTAIVNNDMLITSLVLKDVNE